MAIRTSAALVHSLAHSLAPELMGKRFMSSALLNFISSSGGRCGFLVTAAVEAAAAVAAAVRAVAAVVVKVVMERV